MRLDRRDSVSIVVFLPLVYYDIDSKLLDNCEHGCAHSTEGITSFHAARVRRFSVYDVR